jgi:hypothetical protein
MVAIGEKSGMMNAATKGTKETKLSCHGQGVNRALFNSDGKSDGVE